MLYCYIIRGRGFVKVCLNIRMLLHRYYCTARSGPVVMYCERKAEIPLIQLLQSIRWCRVQRVAFASILPMVQTIKIAQTDTFSRQLHKLML